MDLRWTFCVIFCVRTLLYRKTLMPRLLPRKRAELLLYDRTNLFAISNNRLRNCLTLRCWISLCGVWWGDREAVMRVEVWSCFADFLLLCRVSISIRHKKETKKNRRSATITPSFRLWCSCTYFFCRWPFALCKNKLYDIGVSIAVDW